MAAKHAAALSAGEIENPEIALAELRALNQVSASGKCFNKVTFKL